MRRDWKTVTDFIERIRQIWLQLTFIITVLGGLVVGIAYLQSFKEDQLANRAAMEELKREAVEALEKADALNQQWWRDDVKWNTGIEEKLRSLERDLDRMQLQVNAIGSRTVTTRNYAHRIWDTVSRNERALERLDKECRRE